MALQDQFYDDLAQERLGPRRRADGAASELDPATPTATPAPAAPNYQTLGQFGNKLQGYDMAKFQQPYDQWSEKYKIGAVQSHFDPLAGVSGEYLNALNSLGIANFSGSGDQLSVKNTRNDPRFGVGGTADVVKGLKGQNQDTAWRPWFVADGGGAQPQAGIRPAAAMMGGHTPSPTIGGGGGGAASSFQGDSSEMSPAEASAAGLAWVPKDNPMYGHPGYVGSTSASSSASSATGPRTDLESMLADLVAQQKADAEQRKGFRDSLHGTVMDQIQRGSAPVDENDPSITQPMRAFSGQQDRALAQGREALAARAQHGGMPTGAFDSAIQSSYENLGTDKGSYNAQLIGDQLKQKQAQLQNALTTGAGMLSAEEARGLQAQLASLDTRIKQMDLKQSGAIANRDLDIRGETATGQLALANRTEDDRTNMFYDQMGLDVGNREAALNQSLMQMLYGG